VVFELETWLTLYILCFHFISAALFHITNCDHCTHSHGTCPASDIICLVSLIHDNCRYRGADYLGPMTGDYVINEISGSTKFQYSLTVNASGCIFLPQSWREMKLGATQGTTQNIWHRGVSCFYYKDNFKIHAYF